MQPLSGKRRSNTLMQCSLQSQTLMQTCASTYRFARAHIHTHTHKLHPSHAKPLSRIWVTSCSFDGKEQLLSGSQRLALGLCNLAASPKCILAIILTVNNKTNSYFKKFFCIYVITCLTEMFNKAYSTVHII